MEKYYHIYIFTAISINKGVRVYCSLPMWTSEELRKGKNTCHLAAIRLQPLPRVLSPKELAAAAAAAAKLLQSCLTLCDPIDSSPPGSPVPGILQARIPEWVAISFSNAWKWKGKMKSLSRVWLLVTPWTAVYQALLPMGFSRRVLEWVAIAFFILLKITYIVNAISIELTMAFFKELEYFKILEGNGTETQKTPNC